MFGLIDYIRQMRMRRYRELMQMALDWEHMSYTELSRKYNGKTDKVARAYRIMRSR